MDQARFDGIARALAGSATRRSALGLLASLAAGMATATATATATENAARRRCRKDSPPGQCCRKRGGEIACTCRDGGTPCGDACCATDERCEQGACAPIPPQPACIPPGEPCKGLGRRCCDGRECASGQGGEADVACYAPAGAACATTADCAYGSACENGRCALQCTPVQVRCGEICTDPTIDRDNCATCGNRCLVLYETCVDGACSCGGYGPSGTGSCCQGGTGKVKSISLDFPFLCTPETEAEDCYQGWTCCAGRCTRDQASCSPCDSDADCTGTDVACCDGRCQTADESGCYRYWTYAYPDTCRNIGGQVPCPDGYTPCEGKIGSVAPTGGGHDDIPGWACCPPGSACDRERGVCLRG